MHTNFIFGFKEANIEKSLSLVENALGIKLELHESLYYGGDYYLYNGENLEKIILRKNLDLIDNEPYETDFKDYDLLLCIESNKEKNQNNIISTFIDEGIALA